MGKEAPGASEELVVEQARWDYGRVRTLVPAETLAIARAQRQRGSELALHLPTLSSACCKRQFARFGSSSLRMVPRLELGTRSEAALQ